MPPNYDQFELRIHREEEARGDSDIRRPYDRDRARIIHSAGFRRLQGKTQVMGVGEGDFHRTRLTHSIESAQIGQGLTAALKARNGSNAEVDDALPPSALIEAACFAHDLGHPPFGHGGEKALHTKIMKSGGFEGNGQTLRILTKLEKYNLRLEGLNPTRRLVLAILKYGVPYSRYGLSQTSEKPPKCYFDSEDYCVEEALLSFSEHDRNLYRSMATANGKPSPQYMTLDASIMEMADDIAYAVHDLEDIVARKFVSEDLVRTKIEKPFQFAQTEVEKIDNALNTKAICEGLFSDWSGERKQVISRLVNLFVGSAYIRKNEKFEHPLLSLNATHPEPIEKLLKSLKETTHKLVVSRAGVQQLEVRGQRIVASLFDEFIAAPDKLIPTASWEALDSIDSVERRVADYIAGMTDTYAQKIYQRLFTPGFGSSHDEL